jgi:hypothetical protein
MVKDYLKIYLHCMSCFQENVILWSKETPLDDVIFQCKNCRKHTFMPKSDYVECYTFEDGSISMEAAFGRILDDDELIACVTSAKSELERA